MPGATRNRQPGSGIFRRVLKPAAEMLKACFSLTPRETACLLLILALALLGLAIRIAVSYF